MFGLNGLEIPLLVLLALLFFGGAKLPELAKGFGKSIRTFKDEVSKEEGDQEEEEEVAVAEPDETKPARKPSKKQTTKKTATKKSTKSTKA